MHLVWSDFQVTVQVPTGTTPSSRLLPVSEINQTGHTEAVDQWTEETNRNRLQERGQVEEVRDDAKAVDGLGQTGGMPGEQAHPEGKRQHERQAADPGIRDLDEKRVALESLPDG